MRVKSGLEIRIRAKLEMTHHDEVKKTGIESHQEHWCRLYFKRFWKGNE